MNSQKIKMELESFQLGIETLNLRVICSNRDETVVQSSRVQSTFCIDISNMKRPAICSRSKVVNELGVDKDSLMLLRFGSFISKVYLSATVFKFKQFESNSY